jgi:magnesium-transporting ATPase (P-type)
MSRIYCSSASTTPAQKLQIVSHSPALQRIVVVTGDEVNDAPGRKADIGVAGDGKP